MYLKTERGWWTLSLHFPCSLWKQEKSLTSQAAHLYSYLIGREKVGRDRNPEYEKCRHSRYANARTLTSYLVLFSKHCWEQGSLASRVAAKMQHPGLENYEGAPWWPSGSQMVPKCLIHVHTVVFFIEWKYFRSSNVVTAGAPVAVVARVWCQKLLHCAGVAKKKKKVPYNFILYFGERALFSII